MNSLTLDRIFLFSIFLKPSYWFSYVNCLFRLYLHIIWIMRNCIYSVSYSFTWLKMISCYSWKKVCWLFIFHAGKARLQQKESVHNLFIWWHYAPSICHLVMSVDQWTEQHTPFRWCQSRITNDPPPFWYRVNCFSLRLGICQRSRVIKIFLIH